MSFLNGLLTPEPSRPVLYVQPEALHFPIVHNHDISRELTLTNATTRAVAYKIKATAVDRYTVKPAQGIIPAGGAVSCKIILKSTPATTGMTSEHHNNAHPSAPQPKHKFQVQSFAIPVGSEISKDNLPEVWKQVEQEKAQKLRSLSHKVLILSHLFDLPPDAACCGCAALKDELSRKEKELELAQQQQQQRNITIPPNLNNNPPAATIAPRPASSLMVSTAERGEVSPESPGMSGVWSEFSAEHGGPISPAAWHNKHNDKPHMSRFFTPIPHSEQSPTSRPRSRQGSPEYCGEEGKQQHNDGASVDAATPTTTVKSVEEQHQEQLREKDRQIQYLLKLLADNGVVAGQ